jgi:hypothetical protein
MSLIDKSSRSQQVKVPEAREPLLPLTAGEALLEADEELDDAPVVEGVRRKCGVAKITRTPRRIGAWLQLGGQGRLTQRW